MTKPPSPAWGSTAAPAANFTNPTPSEQASGWPELVAANGRRLSPSRQVLNEWMRRVGAWLDRLGDAPPVFQTPGEAADGLDNGEIGILVARPPNPLESSAWSKTAVELGFAAEPVLVATTHRWAVLHDAANTRTAVVDLEDGAVVATATIYTEDAFATDGRYLYLCGNGSPLRLTLPTTGSTLPLDATWSPAGSFGSDVVAVCTDGVRLYAALSSGDVRAITISSGAVAWTATTLAGETLRGIAVRGPDVMVALEVGALTDGFRAFNASTGAVVSTVGDNSVDHQAVCSDRAGFLLGGEDRYRLGAAGILNGTRFVSVDNCGYHGMGSGGEVLAMHSVAGVWAVMLDDGGGGRVQLRRRPAQTWGASGTEAPTGGFYAWSSGDPFTGLGLTGSHVVMSGQAVASFTSASKILAAATLPQGPRLVRRGHEADPTREAHGSLLEWGAWL